MSRNIIKYVVLTFLTSWLLWALVVLQAAGLISQEPNLYFLVVLGALTPACFGIVLTWRQDGKNGFKRIMKSSFLKYVSIWWVLLTVLVFFAVNFVSRAIFSLFTDNLPESTQVTNIIEGIVFTVGIFFFGGGLDEEIGWRGFLTDKLLKLFKPAYVIIIVGIIWSLWHLPLFFISGTNQSSLGFLQFLLPVAALTVIITWLYYRTESVLLCALLHTFGNLAHEVFRVMPTEDASNPLGFTIFTGIMIFLAVMIFLFDLSIFKSNKRSIEYV